MKNLTERFVRILPALAAVWMLAGCTSGTVDVEPTGPAAASPSPPSPSPDQSHAAQDGNPSSSAPTDHHVLFFATERSTALGTPVGLDFLSVAAQSTTPFGFHFPPTVSVVYWKPVIIGGREEIAWIQKANSGFFLETKDTRSMKDVSGGEVPDAFSWALSDDAAWLAGVGKDGAVFVMNLSDSRRNKVNGPSGFSSQAAVRWVGKDRLAVIDPQVKSVTVFTKSDPAGTAVKFSGEGFTASPSGKTMLLFSDGGLQKIDPAGGAAVASYSLGLTRFENPAWNGENEVAFVDAPSAGLQVTVFDLLAGRLSGRIPVSAPPEQIQSICPAWVKARLYFAGQNDQGLWTIWRSSADGGVPMSIADNDDPTQRFVCPQGVSP